MDHEQTFEAGDRKRDGSCDWLRAADAALRDWFCSPGMDAWNVCEEACGKCRCQDSKQLFLVDGQSRDCVWLDENQAMQKEHCVSDKIAYKLCPSTCGSCSNEVQVTSVAIDGERYNIRKRYPYGS